MLNSEVRTIAKKNKNNDTAVANSPLSIGGISSFLDTKILGSTLAVMRTIGSTNAYIKTHKSILDDGFAILSESQLSGRGRLGRDFISPVGGLYMSVLLADKRFVDNAENITVRASLAVLSAIKELTGLENIGIKWVNDIYCNDKKICGILAERIVKKGVFDYTVLGIGINVTTPGDAFADELSDIAASLSDFCKVDFSKNMLAAYILNNLEKYLSTDDKELNQRILDDYRNNSIIIGKDVYITRGDETVLVNVLGIDDNASLYVRYEDGTTGILRTGEVSTKLIREEKSK